MDKGKGPASGSGEGEASRGEVEREGGPSAAMTTVVQETLAAAARAYDTPLSDAFLTTITKMVTDGITAGRNAVLEEDRKRREDKKQQRRERDRTGELSPGGVEKKKRKEEAAREKKRREEVRAREEARRSRPELALTSTGRPMTSSHKMVRSGIGAILKTLFTPATYWEKLKEEERIRAREQVHAKT